MSNQNQNNHQEFVIRFNRTTLISVALILALFITIILAMLGTFAYMAKPTVIVPTTTAPQPAPAKGDITVGNNEPTLVFPTAIINGATPGIIETRVANGNATNEAWQWLMVTGAYIMSPTLTAQALIPTSTDFPEIATARVKKEGTLSREDEAAVRITRSAEIGQKVINTNQCVLTIDGISYQCPGFDSLCYSCADLPARDSEQICPGGAGNYFNCSKGDTWVKVTFTPNP